mmetsp:Transcript_12620/g.34552  ORF Transcript_12620/g.34552 Transcript_12620/m.34552 type:complete len:205 (+) Transcript_12620:345-959(+)
MSSERSFEPIAGDRVGMGPLPHKGDKYPRHTAVNFKQLRPQALKRYVRSYNIPVRQELSTTEYATAVARHFETHLEVDEDDTLGRFMNYIRTAPVMVESKKTAGTKRQRALEEKRKGRGRSGRHYSDDDDDGAGAAGGAGAGGEEEDDADRPYCFCQRVSYGDMIGCDNDKCRFEWFHLPCVGLAPGYKPRGKWYCPECRRDMA